jgi:hypothetical protein
MERIVSSPFYFVETPHAGELNHRFLVPDDLQRVPPVNELIKIADAAARGETTVGAGFLAASRKVRQQSSNQALREGTETIALVGIEVSRVSSEDRAAIQQKLRDRLTELNGIITGWRGNNPLQGKGSVEPVRFLADWAKLDHVNRWTADDSSSQPPFSLRLFRRLLNIARMHKLTTIILLALFAVALFFIARVLFAQRDSKKSALETFKDGASSLMPLRSTPAGTPKADPEFHNFQISLDRLANECRVTPEALVKDLLGRISGPKQVVDNPEQTLFQQANVRDLMLLRLDGKWSEDDSLVFLSRSDAKYLVAFQSDKPGGPADALNLRRKLWKFRSACSQTQIRSTSVEFAKDNYWHRVVALAQGEKFPENELEPASPFFDNDDVQSTQLLNALFLDADAPIMGLFLSAQQLRIKISNGSLREILQYCSSNRQKLNISLETERSEFAGLPPQTKESVYGTIDALEKFCEAIAAIGDAKVDAPK